MIQMGFLCCVAVKVDRITLVSRCVCQSANACDGDGDSSFYADLYPNIPEFGSKIVILFKIMEMSYFRVFKIPTISLQK